MEKQSDAASDRAHEVANEMNRSGQLLKDSYTNFVENISTGLARTMGMFEENMTDMTQKMVTDLKAAMAQGSSGAAADLKQFSRVQQALADTDPDSAHRPPRPPTRWRRAPKCGLFARRAG